MRIGLIGGTGREGRGLALRWAMAGHHVSIGSRDAERARERAAELGPLAPQGTFAGGDNGWAARESEVVLLSVPYGGHAETLGALKADLEGRILIDITVPLAPPKVREVHLPPGQSAAMEAQALLGAGVRVVAALHHVSAVHLAEAGHVIDCDVLVCADDDEARARVIALVADLGLRGLDAGPLCNAIALESITPVLLHLNKKYKTTSGVRFTGIG